MRAEARKAPVRFAIASALSLCVLGCGRSPLDLPELEPSVPVPGVTDAGDEFPVEPDCSAPLRSCGPVELPPPARYHCALDDPATWGETLVAVIAGTSLYLVQGGGAVLEAHHFSLVEDEEHYVPTATLVARGPRIGKCPRSFGSRVTTSRSIRSKRTAP